jgi:hypothetical protein
MKVQECQQNYTNWVVTLPQKFAIILNKYHQRKPITHLATCYPLQLGTIIQHLVALIHELAFPKKITTHRIFGYIVGCHCSDQALVNEGHPFFLVTFQVGLMNKFPMVDTSISSYA